MHNLKRHIIVKALASLIILINQCASFTFITKPTTLRANHRHLPTTALYSKNNWIERSTPAGISAPASSEEDESAAVEYAVGIDGTSYDLGPLSQKIHEAVRLVAAKRFPGGKIPAELSEAYKMSAMDLAAKEATKLALEQNNLQLAEPDREDWGEMDDIRFENEVYPTVEDAVREGGWEPGNVFSFVVRNVLAKEKELSMDQLMDILDPKGIIREELQKRDEMPDDPMERILSLRDLVEDNERRCNEVPIPANPDGFVGQGALGNVLDVENILRDRVGRKDKKVASTIMRAFESNSYLIIKLNYAQSQILYEMWQSTQSFFENPPSKLPSMDIVTEAGSRHAVVGYASYEEDTMQFLETRIRRSDGNLWPQDVLDEENSKSMVKAFYIIADIGKEVTKIALSEANLYASGDNITPETAWDYALKATRDFVDDGTPLDNPLDTPICMSPHRICRYSHPKASSKTSAKEIFGSHTDTSFITIVPVAAVNGLEVFDEDEDRWVRPELIAQQHYENSGETTELPWHCSYLVLLPGELLELVTRAMIPASIHRVIAVKDGDARLSAPVLLRARSKVKMDVAKYFGHEEKNPLLLDSEGLTMEEIHDTLQPRR